jgi:predicted exporter
VLEALGTTVAPGAFLALLFAAVLTPRLPRVDPQAAPLAR